MSQVGSNTFFIENKRAGSSFCKWQPPPEGFAKMNVDVGYRHDTGEASTGIIFRDCRGLVLLAACKKIPRCTFATQAEALACLEGVQLATE